MSRHRAPSIAGVLAGLVAALALPPSAHARTPTLDEYRQFRALSVDLLGRMPTRAEVAALERPDFDLDRWIDAHLAGPAYVDRVARVYMDLLRLEDSPSFIYAPPSATLHRVAIVGPAGQSEFVYYRFNQRRAREATDGEFCLAAAETGLVVLNGNNQPRGTPIAVSQEVLDKYTTVVRPWWLYLDYRQPEPMLLYKQSWRAPDPLFQPVDELVNDPDKRPTVGVRVCREEAQEGETGHVFTTGRKPPPPSAPAPSGAANVAKSAPPPPVFPFDRARPLPLDDGYAVKHVGESISCRSSLAAAMTLDCGCGPALERCMPGADTGNDPRAFALPSHIPIGIDAPVDNAPQSVSAWHRLWWSEEARHFLAYLFDKDRDVRELVTARYSLVNGPLVQFYRSGAAAACCNREKAFNLTLESEPLLDAARLPDLAPSAIRDWRLVADRGPHAAGILTMPIFLTKFASRRARAAILYSALTCKSFVAGGAQLLPSTEPNLMKRPGCATCHATLEPLAAYWSRVEETSWVYLPEWQFPLRNLACKRNAQGKIPGYCEAFYDPAFSDDKAGLLRGAYASIDHAAAGPLGAGEAIAASPEFARCTVERVTASFLGRPIGDDDTALLKSLTEDFVAGGYRMKSLVRAIVRSDRYRRANNLRATAPPASQ